AALQPLRQTGEPPAVFLAAVFLAHTGYAQLGVRRGQGILSLGKRLLIELLARPQPGVHDPDLVLAESREPDEIAREVRDSDRLAHVHHENLPPPAHPP